MEPMLKTKRILMAEEYKDLLRLILTLAETNEINLDREFVEHCVLRIHDLADLIEEETNYASYLQRLQH